MKMSLDTHDPRTCYADLDATETYNAERAEAYARRHQREVIEVWRSNNFDRAFKLEAETVRP